MCKRSSLSFDPFSNNIYSYPKYYNPSTHLPPHTSPEHPLEPFTHTLSSSPSISSLIHSINGNLSTTYLRSNLEVLTNFTTRYYNSDTGRDSMKWIIRKVQGYIKEYGYYEDMRDPNGSSYSVGVREFVHPWKQGSIVSLQRFVLLTSGCS